VTERSSSTSAAVAYKPQQQQQLPLQLLPLHVGAEEEVNPMRKEERRRGRDERCGRRPKGLLSIQKQQHKQQRPAQQRPPQQRPPQQRPPQQRPPQQRPPQQRPPQQPPPAAAAHAAAAPPAAALTAASPAAAALAAAALAAASHKAAAPDAATPAAALPALAATAALRAHTKVAAGERRAIARTSALAKRREGSLLGTPETLGFPELESFELDVSLDLEDREVVFSPPPEEMMSETDLGKKLEPATKPVPPAPLVLTEEEKRELEADLERIGDQLVATLNAACSKKKKKR
jgi:hypothetical protein